MTSCGVGGAGTLGSPGSPRECGEVTGARPLAEFSLDRGGLGKTYRQLVRARNLVGRVCALFFLVAMVAVVDGLAARWRTPDNVVQVLPGETVEVSGPLREPVRRPEDLTCTGKVPGLTLEFGALQSGYFWGDQRWRGRLQVSEDLAPGKYSLVIPKGYELKVVVYPDPLSRQQASPSLLCRLTGVPPFLGAAAALPFIAVLMAAVFLWSRRIAELQAGMGLAEVYHVAEEQGRLRLTFGLGARHGLKEGDEVRLLDPGGRQVGLITVKQVSAQDATGWSTLGPDVRPGFLVALKRG